VGKLILNCGDYDAAPPDTEILGDMTMTPAEMSDLGKGLQAPLGDRVRHVFSNSDHVLNGVRIAIIRGTLNPDDLLIDFHLAGNTQVLHILPSGSIREWPGGFFDQYVKDVQELGQFRRRDSKP
jgi:predicted ATPase